MTDMQNPPRAGVRDTAAALRERLGLNTFYAACVGVSLTGGTQSASEWLDWHWVPSVGAIGLVELGGIVISLHADQRRELGEHARIPRAISAAVALGAVGFQIAGHINHPIQAAFFGGMSALGYGTYLIDSAAKRRDALRAKNELPPPKPQFGIKQWMRHPIRTADAVRLDRGTDDRAARALAAVETDRRNRKTVGVASRISRKQMEKAFGKERAELMVGITDFPALVEQARGVAAERSSVIADWIVERATLPGADRSTAAAGAPRSTGALEQQGAADVLNATPGADGNWSAGALEHDAGAMERTNAPVAPYRPVVQVERSSADVTGVVEHVRSAVERTNDVRSTALVQPPLHPEQPGAVAEYVEQILEHRHAEHSGILEQEELERSAAPADAPAPAGATGAPRSTAPVERTNPSAPLERAVHPSLQRSTGADVERGAPVEQRTNPAAPVEQAEPVERSSTVVPFRSTAMEHAAVLVERWGKDMTKWPSQRQAIAKLAADNLHWSTGKTARAYKAAQEMLRAA